MSWRVTLIRRWARVANPLFLLLFVALLIIFFIQRAHSFINFFFHRLLQNISLFLDSGGVLNIIFNISIRSIVFIAIFKYGKIFRFVKCSIILFNQRSNFITTLKSNKFFNLFNIIVFINTFSIRRYDSIITKLTLVGKVFLRVFRTASKIMYFA